MRRPTSLLLVSLVGSSLYAGAIRPTRQMGPMARRAVARIRTERTARDTARVEARLSRRVAVVEVKTPGDDPDVATRIARAFEGALRDKKLLIRPYRKVRSLLAHAGEELLETPITLRQLARRLRVGRLLRIEVLEYRLADGRTAGFAAPSWWGPEELAQEFAEVHLRLKVFDSIKGKVTLDRQDRAHFGVHPASSAAPPGRDQALDLALDQVIQNLLRSQPKPAGTAGPGLEEAKAGTPASGPPAKGSRHRVRETTKATREGSLSPDTQPLRGAGS